MISSISALALFILVLFNGCFSLPVLDGEISSSTNSPINNDITTGGTFNLFVADSETTILPSIQPKQLTDEHMGFDVSNSSSDLSGNKFVKSLRASDDLPFTTDVPADTIGGKSIANQFENNTQIMQVETTTKTIKHHKLSSTSTTVVPEFTTSNSFTSTTVVPEFTTSESFTSTTFVPEFTTSESFTSTVSPTITTTFSSPSFTSTSLPTTTTTISSSSFTSTLPSTTTTTTTVSSSSFIPTSSSTTTRTKITSSSTSTEKYVGFLKDDNEHDEEYEQTTKSPKIHRKSGVSSTKKSKVNVEYKPKENPNESTIPTAVFDQQALDKVANIPNDFLILDENNDLVVTGLPNQTFTTVTKAYKNEEEAKPLNQGEKSSHS